jgi:CheY-like chemotaxis protein
MTKILIVDDEDDIRLLIKTLLEDEGYEVNEAKDGRDGMDKLKKGSYSLVLLDFFMPGMSGREVLEKIRADDKLRDTKIIFLTVANFSAAGEDELKKLKCMDYIRKPFENDDFLRRVKKALQSTA